MVLTIYEIATIKSSPILLGGKILRIIIPIRKTQPRDGTA